MNNKVYFIASVFLPALVYVSHFFFEFTEMIIFVAFLIVFTGGILFGLSWCRYAYEKMGMDYVERYFFQKSLK